MNFDITDLDTGFLITLALVTVVWGIAATVFGILIKIVFAIAVYRDAARLDRVRTLG